MIRGDKTYLTAVDKSSIEQLRVWRNEPGLRRFFREHREISPAMQLEWYETRVVGNKDKQVDFEIHDLESGRLIGHCGLYYINWINRTAELSVYIGDGSFRGGGYGRDALTLLMDYGFLTLNLNRIWCEVFSNNSAIYLYRKLGFVDEGTLRQHHFDDGAYLDCHLLGLLRSEWRKEELQ